MSVSVEFENNIAWVTVDNPPVNAASQAVRSGLLDAVSEILKSDAKAAILRCVGRTFIAGADVREFDRPPEPPHLPDVCAEIEGSAVPWVALVHGTALGAGLELCLSCTARIAVPDAKMGLPEVTLGLIPGAGGTVRLPRLVDPTEALTMISTGRPISAAKAASIGLIDEIATGNPVADALTFARRIADEGQNAPLLDRPAPPLTAELQAMFNTARGRAKGQNSIIAAVDAVERALTLDSTAALAAERKAFLDLKADEQSLALRHIFFAERSAGKLPQTKGVPPLEVKMVGVIGGGTMGSGIAAACLMAGLRVTMIERDSAALEAGRDKVNTILVEAVQRSKLTTARFEELRAAFVGHTTYAALSHVDLVIEAVFEDMDVKREVFEALDDVVPETAILASNTSYLDVAELAAQTKHPGRVLGLHFFSPAHIMKLLEVIVPASTAPTTIATGLALGKKLGKISVPSGVCDGFIGNRIMSAYRRAADEMVEDGAWPQDIDGAMRAYGFPIGVFQMQDLAGLDIAWAMRKRRAKTRPPSERYVRIADQLCELGRFGRKVGRGWYDYRTDPKGAVDPEVISLIKAERSARGVDPKSFSASEIMMNILKTMQTVGQAILDEGIAASPDAIDVVMVNGYGFPRWRGGPMFASR